MATHIDSAAMTRQAGRSMLEMMIALAIGALMTGVVLATLSGAGLSGRRMDGQTTLNENGLVSVNLLAGPLRMAGYWQPGSEVAAVDSPPDGQPMLYGCDDGFVDVTASWATLACAATGLAGQAAVAIRFEAGEAGTPMATDCAGRDVRSLGLQLIEDRYFVQATGTESGEPALYCQPTSGGPPVMVADKVEGMTLRYGVSQVIAQPLSNRAFDRASTEGRTALYLTAKDLVSDCTPGALPQNSWCAVTTVDVCLLVRSADGAVAEAATPYVNCSGTLSASDDRRLRRASTTSVSLRNRTATPLRPAAEAS